MTMNRDEIESAIRFVYRKALDTDEDVATVGLSLEERIKAATVVLFTGNLDQLGGYELEESVETIRNALIQLKEHGTV